MFGGWACGLQVYQPGQQVQLTGDVTVKAIWNAESSEENGIADQAKDAIGQVVDFIEAHVFESAIALILVVLGLLYIRSRRMY